MYTKAILDKGNDPVGSKIIEFVDPTPGSLSAHSSFPLGIVGDS